MVSVKTVLDLLVCAISLLGVAPLYIYLDPAPKAVFPIALTAAVFMGVKRLRPLRGLLPTAVSAAFFIFYALQFSRDNLEVPAVNILAILLSIRLLSEKAPRHYLQIYALSLFSLAASSIFSLSAAFLVYLIILILCIAVSLVLLTFHSVDSRAVLTVRGLKRVTAVAAAMPAASLPLVVVFFIIIPRPQFPLWDLNPATGERVTGFSDRVEPGSTTRIREARNPVLRAEGERLPAGKLYWRGIVLSTPKGNAWVRTGAPGREQVEYGRGEQIRQTVFPEPAQNPWLMVLDPPLRVGGRRVESDPDQVFRRRRGNDVRFSYETFSSSETVLRVRGGIDREFYLRLPERLSPRIRSLGKRIAERGATDAARLSLLEDYFAGGRFRYSTRDLPHSADPMDEFLFEKKSGHCEFFASSFATLLRAAGVPSRLVAGYYGGDYNDIGGYYLVTSDMAHVWVEVYLEGTGWVRKDPSAFAVNFEGERGERQRSPADKLRMLADSMDYYWNIAVITYDLDKQVNLFIRSNSALRNLSVPFGVRGLLVLATIAGLSVAACRLLMKRRRRSREERILGRFLRKIRRKYPGESISSSTGLHELAERTGDPGVRGFVDIYCGALYRDRKLTQDETERLKAVLREL